MKKIDSAFVLRWAKKIKAINMLGGKCLSCKTDDIFVLVFHHKDNDKDKWVADIIGGRWNLIEKEISKCELLCHNCHIEIHCTNNKVDSKAVQLKKYLLKYKNVNCCQICGYAGKNFSSLDFHHCNENLKAFEVCEEIKRRKSMLPHIIEEVDKCDVICKNCHYKKNVDVIKFNKFKHEIFTKSLSIREQQRPVNKEKVFKLFKGGMIKKDIAREICCAKSTISSILKNY